jgi:hypothetical protein
MEERPPIWRVAVNKLNKQPRTADKVWSSSLGVGRGANNPSTLKTYVKNYPCSTCGHDEELSSSINAGNFLTSGKVYWLASQERLCSID